MTANGVWPVASSSRRAADRSLVSMAPDTKRALPSSSSVSASTGDVMTGGRVYTAAEALAPAVAVALAEGAGDEQPHRETASVAAAKATIVRRDLTRQGPAAVTV